MEKLKVQIEQFAEHQANRAIADGFSQEIAAQVQSRVAAALAIVTPLMESAQEMLSKWDVNNPGAVSFTGTKEEAFEAVARFRFAFEEVRTELATASV